MSYGITPSIWHMCNGHLIKVDVLLGICDLTHLSKVINQGKMKDEECSPRTCKVILSKRPWVHYKMSRDSLRDNGISLYHTSHLPCGQGWVRIPIDQTNKSNLIFGQTLQLQPGGCVWPSPFIAGFHLPPKPVLEKKAECVLHGSGMPVRD